MKLFIITCIKEHQKAAAVILQQAGIGVFSASPISGFKSDTSTDLLDSWYASSNASFDAVVLFAFTPFEQANNAFALVEAYNSNNEGNFPLRAFILNVEQTNYSI
jgi:hypothetical protein